MITLSSNACTRYTAGRGRIPLTTVSEVPIRYAISILHHEDKYHAIIHSPSDNVYAQASNPNLTKLMNLVSSRVRKKEKEMKNFPLPEEKTSLIVLPNGS